MPTQSSELDKPPLTSVRLDRWLWAARFFKTRSLAKAAIEGGKVSVSGNKPKPSKDVEVGQRLTVRVGGYDRQLTVTGLAEKRGSATLAQTLYQESAESVEAREVLRAEQRMHRAGLRVPKVRPDKHQRQAIKALKQQAFNSDNGASDGTDPE